MKTPQEIESLAWERLAEAKLLYKGGKFDGAFYLHVKMIIALLGNKTKGILLWIQQSV